MTSCKNCNAEVTKEVVECPKCKTFDPLGNIAKEALKWKEYFIKDAEKHMQKIKRKQK